MADERGTDNVISEFHEKCAGKEHAKTLKEGMAKAMAELRQVEPARKIICEALADEDVPPAIAKIAMMHILCEMALQEHVNKQSFVAECKRFFVMHRSLRNAK